MLKKYIKSDTKNFIYNFYMNKFKFVKKLYEFLRKNKMIYSLFVKNFDMFVLKK